jgi:hypothetical protein
MIVVLNEALKLREGEFCKVEIVNFHRRVENRVGIADLSFGATDFAENFSPSVQFGKLRLSFGDHSVS